MASMSIAALPERLRDPQWFALAWYGQALERLAAASGLVLVPASGAPNALVARLPGAATGHLVAVSSEFIDTPEDLSDAVVVGGPCLGDCLRYPTLESLYDSVQTVLVAKALNAPALLYLGDREEVLGSGGEGKWGKLALRFEEWLPSLAAAVGFKDLTVVRTSTEAHERALEDAGHAAKELAPESLDRAFHLGSFAVKCQDEPARAVTRRVIAAHLPEVVARHLGADRPRPVVMAENLQQAEVYNLANRLAAAAGQKMAFVGHFPAPSPSAGMRMYRAQAWDKIAAWDLATICEGTVANLHPYTRQFFASWLTPRLRTELTAAARTWPGPP